MNEYEQIMKRAKEQGLSFDGKDILIPIAENQIMFNGEMYFGRIFSSVAYILRDVEEPLAEKGSVWEPFIYRLVDHYETWLTGGSIAYRTDFYVVE